jgi:hypothetical protein|tara:strand:+ start:160 stop:327 length:168 start_codon:yes stop_codon:yes gene_type:complete
MTHARIDCAIKLKALLDKLDKLKELSPTELNHAIDDCRVLARELSYESEFISGLR